MDKTALRVLAYPRSSRLLDIIQWLTAAMSELNALDVNEEHRGELAPIAAHVRALAPDVEQLVDLARAAHAREREKEVIGDAAG